MFFYMFRGAISKTLVPTLEIFPLLLQITLIYGFPKSLRCLRSFTRDRDWYGSDHRPLFKGRGEVNFDYLPQMGGIWKIKKRGWKYGTGADLLKWGRGGGGVGRLGWHFSYLIFSRFSIFTVRNDFTFCKIVLCIWRKNIFFCHHVMKKGYSKLSKNEPENIPSIKIIYL